MESNTPFQWILVAVSVLYVSVLVYKSFRAFFDASHALGDMAKGMGIALLVHIEKAKKQKEMFYIHPWTPEEARIMLQELRLQLKNRSNIHNMPELAVLGPDKASKLLTLAVLAKVVPSTLEIMRRIAFLEGRLHPEQRNTPSLQR